MTLEQIESTIEAVNILQNHADWLSINPVGKQIRVSAWLRLQTEARHALTGAGLPTRSYSNPSALENA